MEQHGREQEVIPAEVASWTAGWDEIQERMGPRFARSEQRQRVRRYVEGWLSPIERKNGWQVAEQAGEARPYGMQRLLAGAQGDAVRDDWRVYVLTHRSDPRAVWVIDETGFLKQGTKSVGVKRQYRETAGRIETCQIGVLPTSAAPQGHVLLDRELSLPREWADDAELRQEAGVPQEVRLATKPQVARHLLEQQEQPFVLAVTSAAPLFAILAGHCGQPRADRIATDIPAKEWRRLAAGAGTKGPRTYDWARVRLARLQLTTEERRWEHWLLVRRSRQNPTDLASYVVFAPTRTSLRTLVRVAGQRWRIEQIRIEQIRIEQSLERAKGEVGLDHDEVRRWDGWDRHMTLALFALAYLAVLRARLQAQPVQSEPPSPTTAEVATGGHTSSQSTCASTGYP